MRLYEIAIIDLAEKAIIDLQRILKEEKLLENNIDVKDYTDFVANEKSQCADENSLSTITPYFPLYFNSVPLGKIITGKYSNIPCMFIKTEHNKLVFHRTTGEIRFPMSRSIGDGFIDTLIFDTLHDQKQFLTILHLKFSGWRITIGKS